MHVFGVALLVCLSVAMTARHVTALRISNPVPNQATTFTAPPSDVNDHVNENNGPVSDDVILEASTVMTESGGPRPRSLILAIMCSRLRVAARPAECQDKLWIRETVGEYLKTHADTTRASFRRRRQTDPKWPWNLDGSFSNNFYPVNQNPPPPTNDGSYFGPAPNHGTQFGQFWADGSAPSPPLGNNYAPSGDAANSPLGNNDGPSGDAANSPLGNNDGSSGDAANSPLGNNDGPSGDAANSPLGNNDGPSGDAANSPLGNNDGPSGDAANSPPANNDGQSGGTQTPPAGDASDRPLGNNGYPFWFGGPAPNSPPGNTQNPSGVAPYPPLRYPQQSFWTGGSNPLSVGNLLSWPNGSVLSPTPGNANNPAGAVPVNPPGNDNSSGAGNNYPPEDSDNPSGAGSSPSQGNDNLFGASPFRPPGNNAYPIWDWRSSFYPPPSDTSGDALNPQSGNTNNPAEAGGSLPNSLWNWQPIFVPIPTESAWRRFWRDTLQRMFESWWRYRNAPGYNPDLFPQNADNLNENQAQDTTVPPTIS